MKKESFKQGITDGIPIALGYLAVSFTFGMMAVQGGLTIWQAVLISLTNLTSAGQFAGLDIIIAGGSLWEMALTQLIINLRYCLMSFSLSQKLRRDEPWGHRYGVAFGVTDEIFGVSASKPGKVSAFYNYGVMSVAIPGWTFGTLLGAVSGSLLPDFIMSALSVAIYGMFLAVIIPLPRKTKRCFCSAWSHGSECTVRLGSGFIKGIIWICDHYHYHSGCRNCGCALPGCRRKREGGSS